MERGTRISRCAAFALLALVPLLLAGDALEPAAGAAPPVVYEIGGAGASAIAPLTVTGRSPAPRFRRGLAGASSLRVADAAEADVRLSAFQIFGYPAALLRPPNCDLPATVAIGARDRVEGAAQQCPTSS